MLEKDYQANLMARIMEMLPGSIVLKNDSSYLQGIPDLTILYKTRWAALEVKKHKDAKEQPNQSYYIETLNEMSYASFIYPENEEVVLNELQRSLQAEG